MFTYPITHLGHNAGGGGGAGFGPEDEWGLFDGVNDSVSISGLQTAFDPTGDFTVHVTFDQTNAATAIEHLVSWSDGTGHFSIGIDGGDIGCRHRYSGTNYDVDELWTADSSVHTVQITWDASTTTLTGYVDGVIMSGAGTAPVSPNLSANFVLGSRQGLVGNHFDGSMFYVSVYDKILSSSELEYERTGGVSGVDPTLTNCLGRYLFDDGAGTTLSDSSGNGRDGTCNNITASTFWNP